MYKEPRKLLLISTIVFFYRQSLVCCETGLKITACQAADGKDIFKFFSELVMLVLNLTSRRCTYFIFDDLIV